MSDDFKLKPGKIIFWSLAGVLSASAIILALRIFLFPLFVANQAVTTARGIVKQTVNADNVLYNYHWFYGEYNDYLALKSQYVIAQNQYKQYLALIPANSANWSYEEQSTVSQDQTIAAGLAEQVQQVIADYNAHSSEMDRNIFKAHNLPLSLPQLVQ